MRKSFVALGIVLCVIASIPIIVVLLTMSQVVWEHEGHGFAAEGKPEGITIKISHSPLATNVFVVGAGQSFTAIGQGSESGYFNLTHTTTGQKWNFSYFLYSSGGYVEYVWDTTYWILPEGIYALEVYNVNSKEGENYRLDYRILNAGMNRDPSYENADPKAGTEYTAFTVALTVGGFIALFGVVFIIGGVKGSPNIKGKSGSKEWKPWHRPRSGRHW